MSNFAFIRAQHLSAYVLWRVLPLAVAAMVLIGFFVLSTTEKTIEKTVSERINRQSDYIADLIEHRLSTVLDKVTLLGKNDLIVNGLIDIDSRNLYLPTFFNSLRLGAEASPRVSLLDYKGVEIFHNGLPGGPVINREEWVEALSSGEGVRYFGEDGMLMAVPVLVHGLPEGAIIASFHPSAISSLFNTGTVAVEIDVVGEQGAALYSSEGHIEHGERIPGDWIEIRHTLSLFSGVEVVTGQQKDAAYSTIYQLRTFLIYTGIAALAALIAAIVYSTYLSSRELRRLSSILSGISRPEHFDRRVDVAGPSEIQTLGTAFNTMLETLQQTTTSRSYLDNILNSLNELLMVVTPGGEIVTLNLEAERFLASRDLTKNANIATAIRADRYGNGQDPWDFLRVTGGLRYLEGVYEYEHAPPKALLWTKSSVRDEDGLETGIVYVASDITERMQMEQMKTEFVSTVSHELRTPLTSILGSVKLVQSGAAGEVSEKSVELLTIAHNNSERLVRLINDILDIQKIEAGQLDVESEPLELRTQIKQAIISNAAYAEQYNVHFRVTEPDREAWIQADTHRLNQVLSNLLSNAAKFSDAGEEIHITIDCDGDAVTISISDTGIGIPKEYQHAVFEKFKQVDASDSRTKGGTGLGLAITKNLVSMMDGEIWFDSAPGEGTTFHVRFPEISAGLG